MCNSLAGGSETTSDELSEHALPAADPRTEVPAPRPVRSKECLHRHLLPLGQGPAQMPVAGETAEVATHGRTRMAWDSGRSPGSPQLRHPASSWGACWWRQHSLRAPSSSQLPSEGGATTPTSQMRNPQAQRGWSLVQGHLAGSGKSKQGWSPGSWQRGDRFSSSRAFLNHLNHKGNEMDNYFLNSPEDGLNYNGLTCLLGKVIGQK